MRTIGWSIALIGAAVGQLRAQRRPGLLDHFLTHAVVLDAGQLAALSRGEVVAKVLPTSDNRDVSVLGVVHVAVPRSFFVDRQRDFANALRVPTRSVAVVFGNPATEADVQALDASVVRPGDLEELQKCRPNECNFKLPAADMDRLRAATDWSSREASAHVAAYVRRRMVEYVTAYRARGNAALVVYDDNGSVRSSDALDAMLRDTAYSFRGSPSLTRHLTDYPRDSLAGAADILFWSLDNLPHVRRVLRIVHETVYSSPELPGTTIIASKQIYASHYFEAGLELLTAVDDSSAVGEAPGGITLVAVRRYRFDHLPRGGLINIRGRVVGGLRDNVQTDLDRLKRESEAAARGG
jgi:hypothetical protein